VDWIESVGERERERERTNGKVRYELLRRMTHLLISHASAPEISSLSEASSPAATFDAIPKVGAGDEIGA
jgi:hypothetical protein